MQAFTEDERVGAWTTMIHSGMLTPFEKRKYVDRIDTLLRAVKQARQRANDTEVVSSNIGEKIFNYILGE